MWITIIVVVGVILIWWFFRVADRNRTPHEIRRKQIIEEMKRIPDKKNRHEYYQHEMAKEHIRLDGAENILGLQEDDEKPPR
ncbi:MAG: hypothetical protein U9P07_03910 [Pseudomonadota bacterium]|nr:hypothetical protein [Pseudomonadota bacterium]